MPSQSSRDAVFFNPGLCWNGLCGDRAAFDSPVLLQVTLAAHWFFKADLSGIVAFICHVHLI